MTSIAKPSPLNRPRRTALWGNAWIWGLFAVVLWAATPAATKLAVDSLSPLAVTLWRSLLAAVLALFLLAILRPSFPRGRRAVGAMLLSAACGYLAFPWLLALGLAWSTASHGALLLALVPILTLGLSAALGRIVLGPAAGFGAMIALVGTALLVLGGAAEAPTDLWAFLPGDVLILLSLIAAAVAYLSGAEAAREAGALSVTLWGHILIAPPLLLLALWVPEARPAIVLANETDILVALGYLAAGSSLTAYLLWYRALARVPAAAQLQFLQPLLGLGAAMLILGERAGWQEGLAGLVIIIGAFIVRRGVIPRAGQI